MFSVGRLLLARGSPTPVSRERPASRPCLAAGFFSEVFTLTWDLGVQVSEHSDGWYGEGCGVEELGNELCNRKVQLLLGYVGSSRKALHSPLQPATQVIILYS
jgi:hypothetical protein